MKKKKYEIDPGVFYPGAGILIAIIIWGFLRTDQFTAVMNFLFTWTTDSTGWFMMIISALIVILCFVICLTPVGDKKVGGPDAQIKHSMFTWIAMITCAGTATAAVFYAVAEPITYFHNPPAWWTGYEPETMDTAVRSLSQAAFHWSFIYYAMYAFWGFIAGYMIYNHKLPARPSSALYPLIKDKCFGPIGKAFDVISILGLVGGMVTSLGLGVTQFAAGLNYVFGITPSNFMYAVTLIVVIASFTLSSIRGVKKGMAIISDINAWIYLFVIVFLVIAGPTLFEAKIFTQVTGEIFTRFLPNALAADSFNVGGGWVQNNTIFYLAWIMAYAPLMGVFGGRIATGYTWRRYLLVGVLGPGIFNIVWFTVFGSNAIYLDAFKNAGIYNEIVDKGVQVGNYALLKYLPFQGIMIPLVVAALFFGFITLADAMTGTLAKNTIKADTHSDAEAPMSMKVVWGAIVGFDTFLCLFTLGTNGMTALQCMSVFFGLPMFIASLLVIIQLPKMCSLKMDKEMEKMTPEQLENLSLGKPAGKVDGKT